LENITNVHFQKSGQEKFALHSADIPDG